MRVVERRHARSCSIFRFSVIDNFAVVSYTNLASKVYSLILCDLPLPSALSLLLSALASAHNDAITRSKNSRLARA